MEMELEEAIQWLNDFTNIIAINKQYTITEGRLTKVQEAVETVLQELEKYKTHDEKYMYGELFSAKQMKFIEKEYIPKKKIENKKEELEEKYNNSVNNVYKKPTNALIDFQRIVGAKEVLKELLEDK